MSLVYQKPPQFKKELSPKSKHQINSRTETDENFDSDYNQRIYTQNSQQGRHNHSFGRTRPVKPQNLNHSSISREHPPTEQNLKPVFVRNPSRERRSSLKQPLPLQKGQKNARTENMNNMSMIEDYSQDYYESNFYDQTANQSFDVANNEELPYQRDNSRNTKQATLRLPKINPNLIQK